MRGERTGRATSGKSRRQKAYNADRRTDSKRRVAESVTGRAMEGVRSRQREIAWGMAREGYKKEQELHAEQEV